MISDLSSNYNVLGHFGLRVRMVRNVAKMTFLLFARVQMNSRIRKRDRANEKMGKIPKRDVQFFSKLPKSLIRRLYDELFWPDFEVRKLFYLQQNL